MSPEEKKERTREYNRRYRAKNPERRRKSCRDWALKNPDKVREMRKRHRARHGAKKNAKTAEWRRQNPEKVQANFDKWVRENPERRKELSKQSRERNRESLRAKGRERYARDPKKAIAHVEAWREKNPELRKQQLRRQRYRRRMLAELRHMPGVTRAEWVEIEERFCGRCAYCLGPASSVDHLTALAVGGLDEAANVVPACRRCNSSKGAKSLLRWLLTSQVAQDALRSLPSAGTRELKG